MAWRRPGDKPLSEPMMMSLLTYKCVSRSQLVKRTKAYGAHFTDIDPSMGKYSQTQKRVGWKYLSIVNL